MSMTDQPASASKPIDSWMLVTPLAGAPALILRAHDLFSASSTGVAVIVTVRQSINELTTKQSHGRDWLHHNERKQVAMKAANLQSKSQQK